MCRALVLAILVANIGTMSPLRGTEPAAPTRPRARIVGLDSREPDMTVPQPSGKLLIRELIRQAILMAARDQLGLETRDQTLREPLTGTAQAPVKVLGVQTARSMGVVVTVKVSEDSGDIEAPFFETQIENPLTSYKDVNYVGLAEATEVLARTKFVDMLRKAGFDGEVSRSNPELVVPEDAQKQLDELNCFSQFAVIRVLHGLHHRDGESPQTLGALSRAYANLGQMAQAHWNASHKVYKARALLYAQRLVATEPASPWGLWHRAYALLMIGLHRSALADLEAADTLAKAKDGKPAVEPPAWVELVDASCHYDTAKLLAAAERGGPQSELAWLLTYLAVEAEFDANSYQVAHGVRALEAVPECLRIADSLSVYGGVGIGHSSTTHGALVLAKTMPGRLRALGNLPPETEELIKAHQIAEADLPDRLTDRRDIAALLDWHPALVKSLLAASDTEGDFVEPSWAALGRLIEDLTFVQIVRRWEFYLNALSAPLGEFGPAAVQVVTDHPYRCLIESGSIDANRDTARYWKLFEKLDIVDVEMTEELLTYRTITSPHTDRMQGAKALNLSFLHMDNTALEVTQAAQQVAPEKRMGFIKGLANLSPYSPQGIAGLIDGAWDELTPEQVADWKQRFAREPFVLAAFARRYLKLEEYDAARQALIDFVAVAPEQWAYEELAKVYLTQGDEVKWQKTLEEYLQQEDFGLGHARIRVQLAEHFMQQKQWTKAKDFADAAAASGAVWAMNCAAKCETGLENWDEAEQWLQRIAARYADSQTTWYFWCKRTGHGNERQAERVAKRFYDRIQNEGTPTDFASLAGYHLLEGRPAEARKAYEASLAREYNPDCGLQLAAVLDELDETAVRDKTIADVLLKGSTVRTNPPNRFANMMRLARLLRTAHLENDPAALDTEAVDALIKNSTPFEQMNIAQYVGRYFEKRGQRDKAIEYYQRAVEHADQDSVALIVATCRLRALQANKKTD